MLAGTAPSGTVLADTVLADTVLADTALADTALDGSAFRRRTPACRAVAVPGGWATAAATRTRAMRPLDAPPPPETSRPADSAAATTAIMLAVTAVRDT